MKPDPVIVLAGSRALPYGIAPRLLVSFLVSLPMATTVALRHPAGGVVSRPGDFEMDVVAMCDIVGIRYRWWAPQPTPNRRGRKSVWDRDMEMLAASDLALCFYDVGQIGDEESGTVALVDKAMSIDVPVYAYAITPEGEVLRVGEHDPRNQWADLVPAP